MELSFSISEPSCRENFVPTVVCRIVEPLRLPLFGVSEAASPDDLLAFTISATFGSLVAAIRVLMSSCRASRFLSSMPSMRYSTVPA